MLLSDLLKTMTADSLGDIDTLMKAAENLEVLVHVSHSPVPLDEFDIGIVLASTTAVMPRKNSTIAPEECKRVTRVSLCHAFAVERAR